MRSSKRYSLYHALVFSPFAVVILAVFTVLSGCSSNPDQSDAEVARKNQASRYTEFGNGYFNDANYEMALNFFDLALKENISVDNLPGIAKSYNSIGRVYAASGNFTEARENYRMALDFARLADDMTIISETHINRGELFLREGNSDDALVEFETARDQVTFNDLNENAILFHNLGTLYARRGDFDEAVEHLEVARTVNEDEQRWAELASNYYMLASIASRREQYDLALSHALNALENDKRAENSPGIAADLDALGQISELTGNDEQAYQYYLRSLRVYLSLNLGNESIALLDRLVPVSERLDRMDEADRFRTEAARIRSRIEGTTGSAAGDAAQ